MTRPRINAVAWCMAAEKSGGPVTVREYHFYDLRTLHPQPGPVIARWAMKYRGRDFRVQFGVIAREMVEQAEMMARVFIVADALDRIVGDWCERRERR